MAIGRVSDYRPFAHRPARKCGVVQEYNINYFIAFEVNIGMDMDTLIADIQRGSLADTDPAAEKLNAQLAGNTPIVSVFH